MDTGVTRENWRQMAQERGLTLVGIAKATGASYRSVSAYSQGTRRPSDAFIARVADLLDALASAVAL